MAWVFVRQDVVFAIHERQISEHGGAEGVRDRGLIEAALARPKHLAHYEEPDAARLAAAYACGLAKNHGFVDGNKRVAWAAARLFLLLNEFEVEFEKSDAIEMMWMLAGGRLSDDDVAEWFRARMRNG